MQFTFNSKESYLSYRAEWKSEYESISKEIRKLKAKKASASDICYSRFLATNLLTELAEAKLESGRQWEAARREVLTSAA